MLILVNVYAIISAVLYYLKFISPLAFLLSSLLWFLLMLLFWFLLPRIIYSKASVFKDRLRTTFTDTYFEIENAKGSRSWNWNEFTSWIESPHFFHLYFNSRSFFIIPKEAFEGDDVHAVRRIIAGKLEKQ